MKRGLGAIAVALVLLTAACGTTVPGAERLAAQRRSADGLSLSADGTADDSVLDEFAADGSGVSGARTASGQRVATTVPGRTPSTRAVVDRTPIKVGAFYLNGGNEILAAGLGGTPVNFGDGQLEARAVVADINSHGGVGGRPIELYLQKFEATDAGDPSAIEAACVALTDDHHVFVIMSMFNITSPLASCAKKRKTPVIGAALGSGDDYIYREYADWVFTPAGMSLDTEQKLVLDNAVASGVVTKSGRVGVIVQNDDEMFPRVYKNTIEPKLKALGVPYESFTIANGADTSGIANAILKFVSNGVTVVQFSAGNGGIPELLFMQAAEQQRYRPKYIMGDSTDTWFVGKQAPRAQAERITGVGSYPIANVNASQYPPTAGEKHCFEVITAAGERMTDRQSSLTATFYCEMFYGFQASGGRVVGKMTADAWRAAYRSMGTTYPAMITFGVDIGLHPNAPAVGYRTLGWGNACSCITYTSELRRLQS